MPRRKGRKKGPPPKETVESSQKIQKKHEEGDVGEERRREKEREPQEQIVGERESEEESSSTNSILEEEEGETALRRKGEALSQRWTIDVPPAILNELDKEAILRLLDPSPFVEGVVVCILAIGRYFHNPKRYPLSSSTGPGPSSSYSTSSPLSSSTSQEVFDILVFDADCQSQSCCLNEELSRKVIQGEIYERQIIRIKSRKVWLDELQLGGGDPSVIIQELEVLQTPPWETNSPDSLLVNVCFERPICSPSGFYLSTLSDDCVVSSAWIPENISFEETCMLDINFDEYSPTIFDIISAHCDSQASKKRKKMCSSCPLIGKVVAISCLNYYGKPGDQNPYPINFQMILADSENSVTVAVWNSACQLYYPSIELGDILVVLNYNLKPSLYASSVPSTCFATKGRDSHESNLEVNVNAKNPEGFIFKITGPLYKGPLLPKFDDFLQCSWFGEIDAASASLSATPDAPPRYLDLAGVITFVGEPWCDRSKLTSKLMLKRWLKVWVPRSQADQDFRSDGEEVSILLYANSQLESFHSISQLEVVMLCNLGVRNIQLSSSDPDKRCYYLESSTSLRLYLGTEVPRQMGYQLLDSWRVQPYLEETASAHEDASTLYLTFHDLDSYTLAFPETEIISFSFVPDLQSSLRILQSKSVILQGFITRVYYREAADSPLPSSPTNTSPSLGRESSSSLPQADPPPDDDDEDSEPPSDSFQLLFDVKDLNRQTSLTVSAPLPFPLPTISPKSGSQHEEWRSLFPGWDLPQKMIKVLERVSPEAILSDKESPQLVMVTHFKRESPYHVSSVVSNFFKYSPPHPQHN